MKVVTFNTRTDNPEDGINNVKFRMPYIKAKLDEEKPDIIGFQELKPHTCEDFKQMLPDYYLLGFGRNSDYEGERIPIGVRKDRFDVIEMGGCWLSDTPDVPGSRYEGQSVCPRTIMWVKLFDLSTHQIFRVYNTHLDHPEDKNYVPRRLELHQILELIDADNRKCRLPFLFMGDFNTFPRNWETEELDAREDFIDFTENVGPTYHNWGNPNRQDKIDYIYGSPEWKLKGADTWKDCHEGVWLSDHYPVCAEVEIITQDLTEAK